MVHGEFERDKPLNQKRHEVLARLAHETRVGWPTLTATVLVLAIGVLISSYLLLHACAGR